MPLSRSVRTLSGSDRYTSGRTGNSPSFVVMMTSAEAEATMPSASASTTERESRAHLPSMPVPTYGDSATIRGTPWRCMLEPIRARLASSCSRKGMRPAAMETSCLGDTSM